jgi:hypothetical protein
MKKTDIERILKQGSVRQKIKLYMTDTALFNVELNTFSIEAKEEGGLRLKSPLLTDKEKDLLWSSIKEPKDIEYYENMRKLNQVFIMFKDKLSIANSNLLAIYMVIETAHTEYSTNQVNSEIINDLLELYPDKKTRAEAYKIALEKTKGWGGKKYRKKGYPTYIEVDENFYFNTVGKYISTANKVAKDAKDYIVMFKRILAKDLPLQPYKDWVKKQEERLIDTLRSGYEITSGMDGYPTNNPKLLQYEEIGVNITQEDIDDFKNSGL